MYGYKYIRTQNDHMISDKNKKISKLLRTKFHAKNQIITQHLQNNKMALNLYAKTIHLPNSITASVVIPSTQELLLACGNVLKWYTAEGKLLRTKQMWAEIRGLAVVGREMVAVTSDSGTVVMLGPDGVRDSGMLGRTGVRRLTEGAYVAAEAKARAIMVAAHERGKLVYVVGRDGKMGSGLLASVDDVVVTDVIGVDVGYENPVFAVLERQNGKMWVVFYELELGLNHVVRKWKGEVDWSSNKLFQVPGTEGDTIGPSGVIVVSKNWIRYRNGRRIELDVRIPKRYGSNGEDTIIVTGVMHRIRNAFFFLVQNEYGDIFKVTLDHEGDRATELKIKYFDTIPISTSLNIFKSGFLFAACESGNQQFYQFIKLGDNEDEPEFNSRMLNNQDVFFHPRELENLQLVEEIQALNPVLHSEAVNLDDSRETPQIYTISGQDNRSSLRSLIHGIDVVEIVSAELPAVPINVWTTKITEDDEFDRYIVLSFANETLVLSIGENVEEITDSGFKSSVSTLGVQQLGRDSLIQIHDSGIRHILASGTVNEWEPPQGKLITHYASNNTQVVVTLSDLSLIYFELDSENNLNEHTELVLQSSPLSLNIGNPPPGQLRSRFLVLGSQDLTVRMFSLDPESLLSLLFTRSLSAAPYSMLLTREKLHIGMANGVYMSAHMDSLTGDLSHIRTRFLGPAPVSLVPIEDPTKGEEAVLALSTRSWWMGEVPLEYSSIEKAAGFVSPDYPDGIVGFSDNQIRIFSVSQQEKGMPRQETVQKQVELKFTPRRMARNSFSKWYYVAESSLNVIPPKEVKDEGDGKVLDWRQFGYQRKQGSWASAVEVVNPVSMEVTDSVVLDSNEGIRCISTCFFEFVNKEVLMVGTTKFIYAFEYVNEGKSISLIHRTAMKTAPSAMIEFQGRLLVSFGSKLLFYDLGTKQLLRKGEHSVPNTTNIIAMETQGNRVIVADIHESLTYLVWKQELDTFIPFADDFVKRHVTAFTMLDYDTAIAGDRFGNVFVLRCPPTAADEDGAHIAHQPGFLNGAPVKLELIAHYRLQDIPTGFSRAALAVGGRESVIVSGLQGSITAFIPIATNRDTETLEKLESALRNKIPIWSGRNHLLYRGYYAPVKNVVDGDLCEEFRTLESSDKGEIAKEIGMEVDEIERKVEDIRATSVY